MELNLGLLVYLAVLLLFLPLALATKYLFEMLGVAVLIVLGVIAMRRTTRFAILALLLGAFAVALTLGFHSQEQYGFTQKKWLAGFHRSDPKKGLLPGDRCKRGDIVQDLICRRLIIGMSSNEVLSFLGSDDRRMSKYLPAGVSETWVYEFNDDTMWIDSDHELWVDFDQRKTIVGLRKFSTAYKPGYASRFNNVLNAVFPFARFHVPGAY
jgi:hypothetical protein